MAKTGGAILKKCQFCNAELPDEASFCLSCASVLNSHEESPSKRKGIVFLKFKKKYLPIAFGIMLLLFIAVCTASSGFSRKFTSLPNDSLPPETVLVPVTKEDGEVVTDSEGETVYEAVTVEPTTKKPSFISEIINSIKDKDKDEDKNSDNNNDKNDNNVSNPVTSASSNSAIGNKPTSTEKDTSSSSEEPSTDNNNTTAPTQSQAPTETEPTTEEEIIQEDPAEVFEFAAYSGNKSHLAITKYKGNAEHVVIPSSYNGQYIVEIQRNAFKDNDKVKIISIDGNRPFFDLKSECFYNCQKLHTINLPGIGLDITSNFAKYCYAMKTIVIKNNRYKFENGGLYYYRDNIWRLLYCCPASFPDTYTIPLWSAGIVDACNLSELSQLRVINCHEYVSKFPKQTSLPSNLEAIYVDAKNKNGYDVNGIAFGLRNGKYYVSYPPSNPTKEFTLPNNSYLLASWLKNPYLETLRIEETSEMLTASSIAGKYTFTNLKTIYIKSGHKDEADIKKFKGTVYTY